MIPAKVLELILANCSAFKRGLPEDSISKVWDEAIQEWRLDLIEFSESWAACNPDDPHYEITLVNFRNGQRTNVGPIPIKALTFL